MATTFKKWNKTEKRNIYYLDYRDENGKRQRPSTGSGSATFANELLIKKIDELNQRKRLPERYSPPVKFSEFVDDEYLPIHAKGQKTEREYKRICEILKAYFGNEYLHKIDARMVEELKKGLLGKVAYNTINNIVNMLSGIFTKAIEWGRASYNPVKGIKRFKIKARTRILERWEQDALINAAGQEAKAPYLQAMVIFNLNAGLRVPSELFNIKWTDIESESKTLHIRAEIAKYEKSRYIDLNSHALRILRLLPHYGEYVFCKPTGKPFKRIDRSFRSAVKRAGLTDVKPHDLRRSFGSNCVMDGVDLATVQAWMGHASIETTMKHYAHLVKSHKKEAIKKIEGRMDTCMDTWEKSVKGSFRKPLKNLVPPRRIERPARGLGILKGSYY